MKLGGVRRGILALALAVALLFVALPNPATASTCGPLPPPSSDKFLPRLTGFLNHQCYQRKDWQHDAAIRTSDGVHPYVKVWYSPEVFKWMTTDQRVGPLPNGAIIVKEMYASPTAPLTEWTVMIKDSNLSWDGWYWGDLVNPSPRNPNAPLKPPRNGCAEPQVLFNGAGLYCLNCHASAIAQSTYSSTAYLAPSAPAAIASILDATNEMAPFQIADTMRWRRSSRPSSSSGYRAQYLPTSGSSRARRRRAWSPRRSITWWCRARHIRVRRNSSPRINAAGAMMQPEPSRVLRRG